MMNHFYLFTKESCGPCGLVKRYIKTMNHDRTEVIEEVDLEDFSDEPIPQDNLDLAKRYDVTATPVLVVTSPNGTILDKRIGGLRITQSIRQLLDQYGIS